MQNFSAQTQLTPDEVIDRAYRQFVERQGLTLIARVMHFHGTEGAMQIEDLRTAATLRSQRSLPSLRNTRDCRMFIADF